MRLAIRLGTPLFGLFLSTLAATATSSVRTSLPFRVPAVYVGFLPCGDCGGDLWTRLQLHSNGTYEEREFNRRAHSQESEGRWRYESSSHAIVLSGGVTLPYFRVVGATTLQPLDLAGDPTTETEFQFARCPVRRAIAEWRRMCERDFVPPSYLK